MVAVSPSKSHSEPKSNTKRTPKQGAVAGEVGYFRLMSNRANARHSTGPRTPEGKARSSQNALKHGFRATSALLDEDPNVVEAGHALFVKSFAPRNAAAKAAVDLAFRCKLRLERIMGAEDARVLLIQEMFGARLQRDRVKFVERGRLEFDLDPTKGMAYLGSSVLGLDALHEIVGGLERDLAEGVWTPTHSARLLAVEGNGRTRDDELDRLTGIADRIAQARGTAAAPLDRLEPRSHADPRVALREAESALTSLRPVMARRLQAAHDRIESTRMEVLGDESAQLRRLMDTRKVEDSPEGFLLQRYKSHAMRDFHRAMDLACRLCGYKASEARSPLSLDDPAFDPIIQAANRRVERLHGAPNEPDSEGDGRKERGDGDASRTNDRGGSGR